MTDRTPDCPPLPRYVDLTDICRPTDDDHGNWWQRNGWAGVVDVARFLMGRKPYRIH